MNGCVPADDYIPVDGNEQADGNGKIAGYVPFYERNVLDTRRFAGYVPTDGNVPANRNVSVGSNVPADGDVPADGILSTNCFA